jgi:hypothetical protein
LNSPPTSFFMFPPPVPRIVSTGLIFPFSYMSTYFHHIHLLHPFLMSPAHTGTNPQTGLVLPSCPLFWRKTFLFKVAVQWVSLWHFRVYVYYNPNWFIPSIFLLSTLVPSYGDFDRFKKSVFILV